MNKKAPRGISRELDQFYTNSDYAKSFLERIDSIVDRSKFECELEPSAGTGSFYDLLDPSKRVGLDLEPKASGIIQSDFFDWKWPSDKRIISIGNPPFGKNANLAVKFFNHAARFSDAIAFIVPKTFRKASIINRLDPAFHLKHDEEVPEFSFIFDGKPYDVWCCGQIWVKHNQQREAIRIHKISDLNDWFSIVEPSEADFSIQRVGGGAGTIRTENIQKYSPLSNYFIRANDTRVLLAFQQIDFSQVKYNTAGNPSVSPSELVKLWIDEARKLGLSI
jgi:hypothetical protein